MQTRLRCFQIKLNFISSGNITEFDYVDCIPGADGIAVCEEVSLNSYRLAGEELKQAMLSLTCYRHFLQLQGISGTVVESSSVFTLTGISSGYVALVPTVAPGYA